MKSILVSLLLLTGLSLQAQYVPMPSTRQINTPYGPANITTYNNVPMYNNFGSGNPSSKYRFRVVLKNDSTFTTKTRIDLSEKKHTLKVKVNKVKGFIRPEQTKEISRITLNGEKLTGIPTDSCWLFPAAKGKINCYSSLAEEGTVYTIAIQKGERGPIVKLDKENLLAMVADNPKCVELVEKKKFIRAIDVYNKE